MPILPCYRACAEVRSTLNDGDVHQLRRGAVSHRLPAVRAHRARPHLEAGTIQIARFRVLDRSTRLELYVRRPCDLCDGVARDEATVCRSVHHTSGLQSPIRLPYALFCVTKKSRDTVQYRQM